MAIVRTKRTVVPSGMNSSPEGRIILPLQDFKVDRTIRRGHHSQSTPRLEFSARNLPGFNIDGIPKHARLAEAETGESL
jgi:hypothetical protein